MSDNHNDTTEGLVLFEAEDVAVDILGGIAIAFGAVAAVGGLALVTIDIVRSLVLG